MADLLTNQSVLEQTPDSEKNNRDLKWALLNAAIRSSTPNNADSGMLSDQMDQIMKSFGVGKPVVETKPSGGPQPWVSPNSSPVSPLVGPIELPPGSPLKPFSQLADQAEGFFKGDARSVAGEDPLDIHLPRNWWETALALTPAIGMAWKGSQKPLGEIGRLFEDMEGRHPWMTKAADKAIQLAKRTKEGRVKYGAIESQPLSNRMVWHLASNEGKTPEEIQQILHHANNTNYTLPEINKIIQSYARNLREAEKTGVSQADQIKELISHIANEGKEKSASKIQQVMWMKMAQNMSRDTIAKTLKVDPAQVTRWLQTGVQKSRDYYKSINQPFPEKLFAQPTIQVAKATAKAIESDAPSKVQRTVKFVMDSFNKLTPEHTSQLWADGGTTYQQFMDKYLPYATKRIGLPEDIASEIAHETIGQVMPTFKAGQELLPNLLQRARFVTLDYLRSPEGRAKFTHELPAEIVGELANDVRSK